MKAEIKSLMKRVLPQNIIDALRSLRPLPQAPEKFKTKGIFLAAENAPSYLGLGELQKLQKKYPFRAPYGYDPKSIEARGIARAAQILSLPGAQKAKTFLELGCWDGMVSCCLLRKGKETTAIDNRDIGFDRRAFHEGVNLLKMDAADLQFADESFDFVFSYDSFEHFAAPESVLREVIRVVKKEGYIYLDFGLLYYSPWGEHAYRSITVPYCQFLFPKCPSRKLLNHMNHLCFTHRLPARRAADVDEQEPGALQARSFAISERCDGRRMGAYRAAHSSGEARGPQA